MIVRHYIKKQYPPKSQDGKPLDYYFWNEVYKDTLNTTFENQEESIAKINLVWKECATNTHKIRKAMKEFPGRLRAVKQFKGSPINMQFR